MIAERLKKPYREYRTITREQAFARDFNGEWLNVGPTPDRSKVYDYRVARDLLTLYPNAVAVDFARTIHNAPRTRYIPPHGYLIYIKATGGHWGKRSRIRVGEGA